MYVYIYIYNDAYNNLIMRFFLFYLITFFVEKNCNFYRESYLFNLVDIY